MMQTAKTKNKGSILIVDDTPENLTVLRKMLTEQGFRVRPAISGEIALKTMQIDLPDLILLDIIMPNMDGYEVCRRLKADEKTQNIPIIFISALNELKDKVKAFSEGGVDYITKPFQVAEVLSRVNTHIKLHSLRKCLEKRNVELQKALDEVKQLRGFLPICANCKNIRDDQGYWTQIESYICNHSEAKFTHSICPDCATKLYPEFNTPKD